MALFPCNGVIYSKPITVGTEWKKFTLNIPAYGKPVDGVRIVGSPGSGYGDQYGLVFPRFDVPENSTVWIDDLSCRQSLNTEFRDDSAVWISGILNKNSTTYYTDEPVVANLNFESAGKAEKTSLGWCVKDVFGKVIASAPEKTLNLPAKESILVKIPETARGWMTLYVTAKTGDRIDEHVLPFGVIERPRPMVCRFGINVSSARDHNINVSIELMKQFRLGSVEEYPSPF